MRRPEKPRSKEEVFGITNQIKVPTGRNTQQIYEALIIIAQKMLQDARETTLEHLEAKYGRFEILEESVVSGIYYQTFIAGGMKRTIAFDIRAKEITEKVAAA